MAHQCTTFGQPQEYSARDQSGVVVEECREQRDKSETDDKKREPNRPKLFKHKVGGDVRNDILRQNASADADNGGWNEAYEDVENGQCNVELRAMHAEVVLQPSYFGVTWGEGRSESTR